MSHPPALSPPSSFAASPSALVTMPSRDAAPMAALTAGASPHLLRQICRIVRQSTWEMYCLVAEGQPRGRNSRHAANHIRQIAIYVCHVGLSIPVPEVASGFGRDEATVRSCCLLVEERRENSGFDDFVSSIERLAKSIYRILGEAKDESRN